MTDRTHSCEAGRGVRQTAGVENMRSQNSKGQRRIQARMRTNLKSKGDPVGFHSGNLRSGKAALQQEENRRCLSE